jgi:hypothetical protein
MADRGEEGGHRQVPGAEASGREEEVRRVPQAGVLAVALATVALAGCGDSGGFGDLSAGTAPTPREVPRGAVVAAGKDPISQAAFERSTKSRVSGISPLNGRATPSLVPLDPPSYRRCVVALKAQAKKAAKSAPRGQKTPVPARKQLLAMCKVQYRTTVDGALSTQIQQQWAISEAAEEGVTVADKDIDATVQQYIAAAGLGSDGKALAPDRAKARYETLLKKSGLTEDDVRFQLRAQLSQQALIQKRLEAKGPAAAKDPKVVARVQVQLQNDLLTKWRPRTLCAKHRLVSQCSNGPTAQPLALPPG